MNWGIITANLLSAAAVVLAFVGSRKADSRAKEAVTQARGADALAQRSAEAAERSNESADRSANAMERMAVVMERRAIEDESRAPTPGAAWRLEHWRNDAYLLTNAGRGTAYEVRVEAGQNMFADDLPDRATLAPGGSAKFLASQSLATWDDTMTVTWADSPGASERHTWSRPLPPRPTATPITSLSHGDQLREALRLGSRVRDDRRPPAR